MVNMRKFATKVILILFLIGSTAALAQVNHRPIEDFTSAQYQIGYWYDSNNPVFDGVIDFGGVANRYLVTHNCGQPDFGTRFSGDITEKALPDGTAQVHVVLHGKNAFMRAFLSDAPYTPVLGYNLAQVCAGATPVLGEFLLTLDFANTAVGAPLPDLYDFSYDPTILPYLQAVLADGKAQGPLRFLFGVPAGTPGFMHVVQRSPYVRGKGVPGHDYFPAELVDVKALGK